MTQNYNVPTNEMLEGSRTKRLLFIGDKNDFTLFDAVFIDPFSDDWEASIEASEAMATAETREDEQMELTEVVEADMKAVNFICVSSKYFVQKAFADSPAAQNKFGLDDFDTLARTQNGIAVFLTNLYQQCNVPAQKAKLLAAGMTQLQIDAVDTLRKKFVQDNAEQNEFIENTTQATADRNKQYNDTYGFWQRVNRASKVVFYGNPIKLNLYAMPHGTAGEVFDVEGKVTDGSNNNAPLKLVEVEIKELGIKTKTNFYGNYGFVGIAPGTYTLSFTLPGYGPKTVPFTLVQDGKAVVNATMQVL